MNVLIDTNEVLAGKLPGQSQQQTAGTTRAEGCSG